MAVKETAGPAFSVGGPSTILGPKRYRVAETGRLPKDTGCEVAPKCLECPLPQCRYDDPGWFQRHKNDERDRGIISALRQDGLSVTQAVYRFGISRRTVVRIQRRMDSQRMTPGMRKANKQTQREFGQDLGTYLRWAVPEEGLEAVGRTFGTTKTSIDRWIRLLGLRRKTVYLLPGQRVEIVEDSGTEGQCS